MAGELNCDVQAAKAGGLLHDIGKALTHETEATHTEIGDEIAQRFGLPKIVRDAIVEHHDDQRAHNRPPQKLGQPMSQPEEPPQCG